MLKTVIINKKPWKRTKEVCKALEYGKATKATDTVKRHCSKGYCAQKYQISCVIVACTPADWPKDSRMDGYYINDEGMHELLVSSKQPKVK